MTSSYHCAFQFALVVLPSDPSDVCSERVSFCTETFYSSSELYFCGWVFDLQQTTNTLSSFRKLFEVGVILQLLCLQTGPVAYVLTHNNLNLAQTCLLVKLLSQSV